MWDLPSNMAAVPDAVCRLILDVARFLCGQGKARYDVVYLQHTLGLSNKGFKLSELSNDKICNKSNFLEVWSM